MSSPAPLDAPTKPRFKRPGLLRAGFHYQDLMAIEVLIRFYRDRDLYDWVELDAPDTVFAAIDDVVARRSDGRFELLQVKFAADPEAEASALSWDWLLETKGAGRSLIGKWAQTVAANIAHLHSAKLRTDRVPDAVFADILEAGRVAYDRVDAETRAMIEAQLGGEAEARSFFAVFEFDHSLPHIVELEDGLRAEVAFDIDGATWAGFREAVANWATLKDHPAPDGRVRHVHLRQVLSPRRPRPIPQDFLVPKGYRPADAAFDTAFMARLSQDGVEVLAGPPGRGKSTYLSHCVERMADSGVICIRHHYFLNLSDRTAARFLFNDIAASLVGQLRNWLPDESFEERDLSGAIGAAAKAAAAKGTRLVIVIDGLDHVWREGQPVAHMNQIFSEILPLPAGVTLAVGTQPARDEEFPVKLLQARPRATWTLIPLMSPEVVLDWLRVQDQDGRLALARADHIDRETQLRRVASAFHQVSDGLPLHLIYAFESLARIGAPIAPADVAALPPCPDGDIRVYYAGLWSRVGTRAQAILQVLAALPFAFPPEGLRRCLGASHADLEALAKVDHMLDYRELGVFPFHGSLFAFIREQSGAAAALTAEGPRILAWLDQDAPAYWRWAWLWLTKAQLGDDADLREKPDRAWAIEALASAYPLGQILDILDAAAAASFARFDLPRVMILRQLRYRVDNGAELQVSEWAAFESAALALTRDPYPLTALRCDLLDQHPSDMVEVLRRSEPADRAKLARLSMDRINARLTSARSRGSSWRDELFEEIGQVAAHLATIDSGKLVGFAASFSHPERPITLYAREALRMEEPAKVVALATLTQSSAFDEELFAACCLEGLDPFAATTRIDRPDDARFYVLSHLRGGRPPAPGGQLNHAELFETIDFSDGGEKTRWLFRDLFFRTLNAHLAGAPPPIRPRSSPGGEHAWLDAPLADLLDMARAIAGAWSDGVAPTMAAFFDGVAPTVGPEGSHDVYLRYEGFRRAIMAIAIDLQLLGVAVEPTLLITDEDIKIAAVSPLWLKTVWLETFVERGLRLHDASGASAVVAVTVGELDQYVTQFAELTDACVRLSRFAADHGLTEAAAQALSRAIAAMIGYGWRKDMYGYEVLSSLEALLDAADPDAPATLLGLAPIFDQITEFTDGDETDHIKTEFYRLLARTDLDRAARAYEHLIRQEEWRYADELVTKLADALPADARRAALLSSFVQPNEAEWLAGRSASVDPQAAAAQDKVARFRGPSWPLPQPRKAAAPRAGEDEMVKVDVSAHQADDLAGLFAALDALSWRARHGAVRAWLDHWTTQGRGLAALAALGAIEPDGARRAELADAYDRAFEIAVELQGRSAGFEWLVKAHRAGYGWGRWMGDDKTANARLDRVALTYPARWREFIVQTAVPVGSNRDGNTFVLGQSRLVYFLIKAGQTGLAHACAEALAENLRAETAGQPLPDLDWAR